MASYQVEISVEARSEIRRLPGNMRQRVIRAVEALADEPRPPRSRTLDIGRVGHEPASGSEVRRLRIDPWRIVYVIKDPAQVIVVVAVRRRPPYQYDDLEALLDDL